MGSLKNPSTPIAQLHDPAVPFVPTQLRAGDSWNWMQAFGEYPANLYNLKYVFNSANNRFLLDGTLATDAPITAAADGETFAVQAASSVTADCPADTYQIIAVLIGIAGTDAAGQQVTLPLQDVTVEPNLATATAPVDQRSFIKRRLDMIEAAIAGDARPDVQEYTIQGRQLRKWEPDKLEALRQKYAAMYQAELRAKGQYARPRMIGFRKTFI
jgi:hypothetical protein